MEIKDFFHMIAQQPYFDKSSTILTICQLNDGLKNTNPTVDHYKKMISDVALYDGDIESEVQGRLTYVYLVQETLKFTAHPLDYSDDTDIITLLERAIEKTQLLLRSHKWLVDVNGTADPLNGSQNGSLANNKNNTRKKRSKLDNAMDIFVTNPLVERGEFIKILIDALGMSKAGAATYYYNCKTQYSRTLLSSGEK